MSSMYSLKRVCRYISFACRRSCSRVALAEASCCNEKITVKIPKTIVGKAAKNSLNRFMQSFRFDRLLFDFLRLVDIRLFDDIAI